MQETVSYVFHLPDGRHETIDLAFTSDHFLLVQPPQADGPDWLALDFCRCPHCPLSAQSTPLCPLARALSGFVTGFDAFYSYEKATVEVVTKRRTFVARRPLQDGMASILGLVGATSGCPHLDFLRPMARFHLPFADDRETLFRTLSIYLLGQYLRAGGQGNAAINLDDLRSRYEAVALVNLTMAERIRTAFHKDVVVNAIVILDSFARAVPLVIQDALAELAPIFDLPSDFGNGAPSTVG